MEPHVDERLPVGINADTAGTDRFLLADVDCIDGVKDARLQLLTVKDSAARRRRTAITR
jgi:hypothetical protein